MNSKITNKKPSVRQKTALTNLVANGGNAAKAMRDAGYSPATARTPKKLLGASSIAGDTQEIIKQLENERWRAIATLPTKIKNAKYGEVVDAAYKLTKTISLMGGKPTEKIEVGPSEEHKARIMAIMLGE